MREDLGLEEVAEYGTGIGAFVDARNSDGELGIVERGEDYRDCVLEGVGEKEEGGGVFYAQHVSTQ